MTAPALLPPPPEALPLPQDAHPPLGRFTGRFASLSTRAWDAAWVRRRLQRKTWFYLGAFNERFACGFAIVDAGIPATAFVYVYDRKTGRFHEEKAMRPFGFSRAHDPDLASTWSLASGGRSWRIVANETGWRASFRAPGGVEIDLDVADQTQGLSMLAGAQGRPFHYTYKLAGAPAKLRLAGPAFSGEVEAGGVADFSKGYPPRTMFWNWASLVGSVDGGAGFGVNLVGDFNNGLENALWVDGRLVPLCQAVFSYQATRPLEPWHIRTVDGSLDVVFTPEGQRAEDLNAGLLSSRFAQPYGTFMGTLRLDGVSRQVAGTGVVEQHWATW